MGIDQPTKDIPSRITDKCGENYVKIDIIIRQTAMWPARANSV